MHDPFVFGDGSMIFSEAWGISFDAVIMHMVKQMVVIISYRHAGQRSRVRKLQYIAELERTVNVFQVILMWKRASMMLLPFYFVYII